MALTVNVYHHFTVDPGIEHKLDRLLHMLTKMEANMATVQEELANLQNEVAEQTSLTQSAITLIDGLAQQIRDNATDPAALRALADALEASQQALVAKLTENTPVPPGS